jgi:Spy/CpxP family protein refolding chaperone
MARHIAWMTAVALVCTLSTGLTAGVDSTPNTQDRPGQKPPQKAQSGPDHRGPDRPNHPRIKWWEDPKWRAEIGINDKQAAQIKEIFDPTMVQLQADRRELDKLEARLAEYIKDERSDIVIVTQKVDRVENLRAQMQKARVLMMYRMHRVLTAEQRTKLEAMFERLQAQRRQNEPKRH